MDRLLGSYRRVIGYSIWIQDSLDTVNLFHPPHSSEYDDLYPSEGRHSVVWSRRNGRGLIVLSIRARPRMLVCCKPHTEV